jgi:hypothetical protein
MEGSAISERDVDQIIKLQVASPAAQTKGYLLDVDFSNKSNRTW